MDGDFRVGAWTVQPRLNTIAGNGRSLRVEPKVMQVLVHLAGHAGDVVEKERLIQAVWADTFVTDDVLTRAISELRRVFEDDPKSPCYIETIPRSGYRLIAPVEVVAPVSRPAGGTAAVAAVSPPPPGTAVGDRRHSLARLAAPSAVAVSAIFAVLLASNVAGLRDRLFPRPAPPAGKVRLVVLPFDNLSGDPEQEYFSDGITEEMTAQLARLQPERLAVIGRASAMTYKGAKKTIDQIGDELGVQYVLEGSVRRSGDRVRITAQLIKVGDQTHVWAESYDRHLRDILALQSDVALSIAREIQLQLTPQAQTRLASQRPINPEAYEFYVKGRFHWDKRDDEDIKKCIEYFKKAIENDPTYAPAYAALSVSYDVAAFRALLPGAETYLKAEALARKALELDPNSGEAHAAMGAVRVDLWDWQGALREFERAIELDPNSVTALTWYAETLSQLGRHEESLRQMERAMKLDPVSLVVNRKYGNFLFLARRYDDALAQLRETLDLYPYDPITHWSLGEVYVEKGMYDDAVSALLKAMELEKVSPQELAAYRKAYQKGGMTGLRRHGLEVSRRKGDRPWAIACLHARLGEKDQAFRTLEEVVERRTGSWLTVEPCFDSLRSDSRYQDLLRRMNFPP